MQIEEARQYFSEGRARSIGLLRDAIRTLEDEIAAAQPIVEAPKESRATQTGEVQTAQPQPPQGGGINLKTAWRRVTRWLAGRIS